jgi:hypothetical protein
MGASLSLDDFEDLSPRIQRDIEKMRATTLYVTIVVYSSVAVMVILLAISSLWS